MYLLWINEIIQFAFFRIKKVYEARIYDRIFTKC